MWENQNICDTQKYLANTFDLMNDDDQGWMSWIVDNVASSVTSWSGTSSTVYVNVLRFYSSLPVDYSAAFTNGSHSPNLNSYAGLRTPFMMRTFAKGSLSEDAPTTVEGYLKAIDTRLTRMAAWEHVANDAEQISYNSDPERSPAPRTLSIDKSTKGEWKWIFNVPSKENNSKFKFGGEENPDESVMNDLTIAVDSNDVPTSFGHFKVTKYATSDLLNLWFKERPSAKVRESIPVHSAVQDKYFHSSLLDLVEKKGYSYTHLYDYRHMLTFPEFKKLNQEEFDMLDAAIGPLKRFYDHRSLNTLCAEYAAFAVYCHPNNDKPECQLEGEDGESVERTVQIFRELNLFSEVESYSSDIYENPSTFSVAWSQTDEMDVVVAGVRSGKIEDLGYNVPLIQTCFWNEDWGQQYREADVKEPEQGGIKKATVLGRFRYSQVSHVVFSLSPL
jgi:hypothetical protein